MKKFQAFPLEKILLFCGFSLALTLAGFWQFQRNVSEAEKLARVQSGVGTCFARVTQTFTAAMIREMNSPYLKRDFMTLSDECLREGTKASGLEIAALPKAGALFNDLVSEVYWFHEKVSKVLTGSTQANAPMQAITEKYAKVEGLKLDLHDQLDIVASQYREARLRDQILVGVAFMFFIASLLALALKEVGLLRSKREVESQALSLLNTGNAQIGAMVDQLVIKGFHGQGMNVTAQVFADYHAGVLERMAGKSIADDEVIERVEPEAMVAPTQAEAPAAVAAKVEAEAEIDARKLLTAQAIRLKAGMEVQEAFIMADAEVLAQLLQGFGQRFSGGEVHLQGVREGDNYRITVMAENICLSAAELNYISQADASMDGVDVNVVIAMDLIRENNIQAVVHNRTNNNGSIVGAEAVFTYAMNTNRVLVNIVRGKKKDLAKAFAPSQFN